MQKSYASYSLTVYLLFQVIIGKQENNFVKYRIKVGRITNISLKKNGEIWDPWFMYTLAQCFD